MRFDGIELDASSLKKCADAVEKLCGLGESFSSRDTARCVVKCRLPLFKNRYPRAAAQRPHRRNSWPVGGVVAGPGPIVQVEKPRKKLERHSAKVGRVVLGCLCWTMWKHARTHLQFHNY